MPLRAKNVHATRSWRGNWQKGFEAFDLSDEFKATARVMFEDAVDAKVEAEVERSKTKSLN
jgi:hypothetical protein